MLHGILGPLDMSTGKYLLGPAPLDEFITVVRVGLHINSTDKRGVSI